MKNQREARRSAWGTLTTLSGWVMVASWLGVGCSSIGDEPADEPVAEQCPANVRNEESDIDCSAACNHVMACKKTGDSDLVQLTCGDCLGSCVTGVSLGGNDLVEGTEEDKTSWKCAVLVTGCSVLDHNCDIY